MAISFPTASAEEQKYELKAASIKDVLTENLNKRVILRMDAGENLEGTVARVGDGLVHITKVAGRDFYDAVVRLDKVSAVVFKVRDH